MLNHASLCCSFFGAWNLKFLQWLSGMDSNHDKSLQRALCYHYTTGQTANKLASCHRERKGKLSSRKGWLWEFTSLLCPVFDAFIETEGVSLYFDKQNLRVSGCCVEASSGHRERL